MVSSLPASPLPFRSSDQLLPSVPTYHQPLPAGSMVAGPSMWFLMAPLQALCLTTSLCHDKAENILHCSFVLLLTHKHTNCWLSTRILHFQPALWTEIAYSAIWLRIDGVRLLLAGTTGCVKWFLTCLFWQWISKFRKIPFLFKILPKGAECCQTDKQMRW